MNDEGVCRTAPGTPGVLKIGQGPNLEGSGDSDIWYQFSSSQSCEALVAEQQILSKADQFDSLIYKF